MKSLFQVRQEYEENYRRMIEVIQQMGGNENIKNHRQRQSTLYRQLRSLQKREHFLDEMENRMMTAQIAIH